MSKTVNYSTDTLLNDKFLMEIIVVVIGIFLIISLYVNFYIPFKKERDYIKMEMERSYKQDEYRHWQRKLKRLYLRSIPFIGRFF